jgi:hypothetical protein
MSFDVRDQCTSPKETAMNHNDKKENQNPPIKDPSSNQSSNPSNPNSKPGMKEDDHKSGSDKSSTSTSGDSKR